MKRKVAIIFGGRSLESDISVITAQQVYHAIDKQKYDVKMIYLYDGKFFVDAFDDVKYFVNFNEKLHTRLILEKGVFYRHKFSKFSSNIMPNKSIKIKSSCSSHKRRYCPIKLTPYFIPDCALICCHGGEGENGILQATLKFNDIPFTSCNVFESALCMDKCMLKRILADMGISTLDYQVILENDYLLDMQNSICNIESKLAYPLIIKPSSMGSSIGIGVANDKDELINALEVAFTFDDKVLVEHKLDNFVEVNCAAIIHNDDTIVSSTEQPISQNDVLSFDDKYMNCGKMSSGGHIMPAPIGELNDVVKDLTKRIYDHLQMRGVIRVDYLIKDNTVYVNEINTIPGSLAFYLFEDLSFDELIDILIEQSIRGVNHKKTVYKSDVLTHYTNGAKIRK